MKILEGRDRAREVNERSEKNQQTNRKENNNGGKRRIDCVRMCEINLSVIATAATTIDEHTHTHEMPRK